MSVIYKTLFEVKIMHEFFLTRKDGSTPFSLADQQQRLAFLEDSFAEDQNSVEGDLEYTFPGALETTYNNYGLKLLTGYSGFRVVVRVKEKKPGDQSLLYKPVQDLPGDLSIVVMLSEKNNTIDRYTNSRIANPVPAAYFFSNEDLIDPRTGPFLTAAIPGFNADYTYEQGELASFGGTDIRGFFKDGSVDKWDPVAGAGFASESDRILVPVSFNYLFPPGSFVTQANFVLKNSNGEIRQTVAMTETEPIEKLWLDFSAQTGFLSLSPGLPLRNSIYTLEVTGNNGYARKHQLLFDTGITNTLLWGVVCMRPKPANDNCRLIAADGFLIKRRDAAGSWTAAPVFEIPVKSRFTYWRYINDKGKELKAANELADYLVKDGKVLITKKPRAMARYWLLLKKEGTTDTKYAPNPVGYELQKDEKNRLCFDIRVPQSELFPLA